MGGKFPDKPILLYFPPSGLVESHLGILKPVCGGRGPELESRDGTHFLDQASYFSLLFSFSSFHIFFPEVSKMLEEMLRLEPEQQLSPAPEPPSHTSNAKLQFVSDSYAKNISISLAATLKICCNCPPGLAFQPPHVLHPC